MQFSVMQKSKKSNMSVSSLEFWFRIEIATVPGQQSVEFIPNPRDYIVFKAIILYINYLSTLLIL